jgi:GDP-L-fucose synthase
MQPNSRVFVAGGDTLIGAALLRRLRSDRRFTVVAAPPDEPDLTRANFVDRLFRLHRPDYVFLAAGKSGGIRENQRHPATLMLHNLLVQTNVIRAAAEHGVTKLLSLASSCSYPKHAPQPMDVDALLTGPLEPTNEAYAVAKIAGLKLCQAYGREYGANFIQAIPANAFGIEDDFSPGSGHVIPALIAKMHAAKRADEPFVEIWGTGTPRREFLFADDLADACLFVMREYDDAHKPINLGGGPVLSIAETAAAIRNAVGYAGELRFNPDQPDGMPLKGLDSRPLQAMGWQPLTPFADALALTYDAYVRSQTPSSMDRPVLKRTA